MADRNEFKDTHAVGGAALPPSVSRPSVALTEERREGVRQQLRGVAEYPGRAIRPDSIDGHLGFLAEARLLGVVFDEPEVFVDEDGKLAGVISFAGDLDREAVKRVRRYARAKGVGWWCVDSHTAPLNAKPHLHDTVLYVWLGLHRSSQ